MTLIVDENVSLPMVDVELPTAPEYSMTEQFNALFQDADPIGSYALSGALDRMQDRPDDALNFSAYDNPENIRAGYESNYEDARNQYDVEYINKKIDKELENKEIAATAPLWMSLAIGVTDPLNALPFNVFRKAGVAAKSVGRTAGEVAVTGAGIAGIREGFLQATQETRTAEESAINILASGLIAGALGGAGAALIGRSEFDMPRLHRETADYLRGKENFNTDFSGSFRAFHGTSSDENEFFGFDAKAPEEILRYDGNAWGDDVVYADASGAWASGTYAGITFGNVFDVEVNFNKAFILTPETVKYLGIKSENLISSGQIKETLKQKGYDGVIITGFDEFFRNSKNKIKTYMDGETERVVRGTFPEFEKRYDEFIESLVNEGKTWNQEQIGKGIELHQIDEALAYDFGVSGEFLQDQIVHFLPERVKVLGKSSKERLTSEQFDIYVATGQLPVGAVKSSADFLSEISSGIKNSNLSNVFGDSVGAARLIDEEIADIELRVRENLTAQGLVGDDLERAVVSGVADERLALEGLANALGLERVLSFQDPVMRMLASPAREVRAIVGRLAEVTSYQKKNFQGIASRVPVENVVKRWDANVAQYSKRLNELFLESRGVKAGGLNTVKTIARDRMRGGAPERMMTKEQFNVEVAKAARRNDTHENLFVAQAAVELRKTVITPLAKEAQRVGLLPEDLDVKTAESYLMRRYNHGAIMRDPLGFDARSKQWMIEKRDAAIARVEEQKVLLEKLKNMLREDKGNLRRTEGATERLIPLAQKKLLLAEKEMNGLEKQVGHYETMLKNINERMARFKPEEFEGDEAKYWNKFLRDLRRGESREKEVQGGETKTLLEFIASKGGIHDSGGDLKSIGANKWHIGKPFRKKLVKDSDDITANTADDMTLAAWEAGYFNGLAERPEINDLYALIDSELRGKPVHSMYRDVNITVQQYNEYLSYVDSLLPKNPNDMNAQELRDFIDRLGAEENGLEPRKYTRATAATRARYKELEYHQKIIADRYERANNAYHKNTAKYMKAASDLLEKREIKGMKIEEIKAMRAQLKVLTKDIDKLADDLNTDKYRAGFLDEDFDQVAIELRERILGSPFGRLDYSYKTGENMRMSARNPMIGVTGSLKARVWDIPDERIEDFLVNDVEALSASYVRNMGAQIGIYDEFGSISLEPQVREINEAFERLIRDNPDKAAKLDLARKSALEDLKALRDRLLGVYQIDDYSTPLSRSIRIMKQLNYMRLLGGMTVSAIPDLGRPIMVHGMNRVFRDGVMGFVNNRQAFMEAAGEVKEAGTAWDVVLNTTALARADLDEPIEVSGKVEQFINRRTAEFSALTLMNPWNAATKQFTGVVAQSRMLQDIRALLDGTLSKNDTAWLASNFINKTNAEKIIQQFEKHGEISGDVYIPNAREWDVETRELFRAAIRKTVDSTIVTQGIDKPLWVDKGLLRLVAQFRGFGLASTQRVMLSGLQMRDMKTLNGVALMTGLGMMVYATKEAQRGRELSDDPIKWIIEGVDRSGVTGWFMDANNITEKFTRGRIGVSALTDDPLMSRYASRGVIGAALGPSVGMVEDLATFTGGLSSGEVDEASMTAGRRLLPYQNHFLFRELFDEAGDNINTTLGIQKR